MSTSGGAGSHRTAAAPAPEREGNAERPRRLRQRRAGLGWAGLCRAGLGCPGLSRARSSRSQGRRPLGGAGGRERGCRSGVTRGHPLCSAGGAASRTPPPPQPLGAEPAPPARPRAARQPLLSWPRGSPTARKVAAVPAPALLRTGEPNGSAGKASHVKLPRLLSWEKKDPCLRAAPETGCKPVQNRDARLMQAAHSLGTKGRKRSQYCCPRGRGTTRGSHRGAAAPRDLGLSRAWETSLREGQQGSTPALETELLPTSCELVTLAISLAF